MKSDEVINYVDDSIILGKDFDGHLKNLDKALEAFEKAGLILNIEKCKLVNQEAEFLGQVITPEGINLSKDTLILFLIYPILRIKTTKKPTWQIQLLRTIHQKSCCNNSSTK